MCVQDLPAFFEDNMGTWMEGFAALLSLPPNPALMEDVRLVSLHTLIMLMAACRTLTNQGCWKMSKRKCAQTLLSMHPNMMRTLPYVLAQGEPGC
jgi:hypothetical protein